MRDMKKTLLKMLTEFSKKKKKVREFSNINLYFIRKKYLKMPRFQNISLMYYTLKLLFTIIIREIKNKVNEPFQETQFGLMYR